MDRMSTSIDDICAYHQNITLQQSEAGGDDDLPPEARPNREAHGYPLLPEGYRIKVGDDVKTYDDVVSRVICAGRGVDTVTTWRFEAGMGQMLMQVRAGDVVDRAPADSAEEALPIFAEPAGGGEGGGGGLP